MDRDKFPDLRKVLHDENSKVREQLKREWEEGVKE